MKWLFISWGIAMIGFSVGQTMTDRAKYDCIKTVSVQIDIEKAKELCK